MKLLLRFYVFIMLITLTDSIRPATRISEKQLLTQEGCILLRQDVTNKINKQLKTIYPTQGAITRENNPLLYFTTEFFNLPDLKDTTEKMLTDLARFKDLTPSVSAKPAGKLATILKTVAFYYKVEQQGKKIQPSQWKKISGNETFQTVVEFQNTCNTMRTEGVFTQLIDFGKKKCGKRKKFEEICSLLNEALQWAANSNSPSNFLNLHTNSNLNPAIELSHKKLLTQEEGIKIRKEFIEKIAGSKSSAFEKIEEEFGKEKNKITQIFESKSPKDSHCKNCMLSLFVALNFHLKAQQESKAIQLTNLATVVESEKIANLKSLKTRIR